MFAIIKEARIYGIYDTKQEAYALLYNISEQYSNLELFTVARVSTLGIK